MFELSNVAVSYDRTMALAPCDLAISAGETVILMGPSGSGKSTLLRTLVGLTPFTGEVRFEETPVSDWRAIRLKLGYVIQNGGLFPHLTARRNVTLMARELGWNDERTDSRVSELAAMAGIEPDQLDRYPAELSGGQCQRVALMRALMLDPDVLLLDEPLSALDPITRIMLAQELRDIIERLAKTVVMVTHNLREARYFGGRALLMQQGRIVQQGAVSEMAERPASPFVSEFLAAEETL